MAPQQVSFRLNLSLLLIWPGLLVASQVAKQ